MSYTCPYCFTPVDPLDIWFQCSVPTCAQADEIRTKFENGLQRQQPLPQGTRLVNYNTTFQGQGGVCPKCQRTTSIRACPICHTSLPPGINNLQNAVFAVVGASSTGKSHYIAVLLDQLKKLYGKFNWSLTALNDETMSLYREKYYNPLFYEHKTIGTTQGARGNADVKKPLVYLLNIYGTDKSVVLAFFDAAGEDLRNSDNMSVMNKYIAYSSGIILLLDPLQIENIRGKIHSSNMLEQSLTAHQNDMLNNIILLHKRIHYNNSSTKQIPLAVVLSKIDLLQQILAEEFFRFEEPIKHPKGAINIEELNSNSGWIKRWLENEGAECIQLHKEFTTSFFAVSALGGDPKKIDGTDVIPGGPKPMHVEDPFLWLLYKNGFIQGK
ncbi:hypothetical protein FACS189419_01570 [Planctomycetales bacterium]|nr:hypothetical protein FACS189419_01570 [Planctomycetales bacterium]